MTRFPRTAAPIDDRVSRHGFTLIELLAVIVVIAILVALILPAIGRVRSSVRVAQVQTEMSNLSSAITAFKAKYGIEPPSSITLCEEFDDWDNTSETRRSFQLIKQIWPQYAGDVNLNGDGDSTDIHQLQSGEALVFFLGGFPDRTVSTASSFALLSFSSNPQAPFSSLASAKREKSAFDFEAGRLVDSDGDGWPEYLDPLPGQKKPILYFSSYDGKGYRPQEYPGAVGANGDFTAPHDVTLPVSPYLQGATVTAPALEKTRFQLISPGFDGIYGPGGPYAQTADNKLPGYTASLPGPNTLVVGPGDRSGERDNITNFGNGLLVP